MLKHISIRTSRTSTSSQNHYWLMQILVQATLLFHLFVFWRTFLRNVPSASSLDGCVACGTTDVCNINSKYIQNYYIKLVKLLVVTISLKEKKTRTSEEKYEGEDSRCRPSPGDGHSLQAFRPLPSGASCTTVQLSQTCQLLSMRFGASRPLPLPPTVPALRPLAFHLRG